MPSFDPVAIGKRLELLRNSRGLSQRELARKANIAQSAISDFEAGKRLPTTKAMDKLLRFFDVSPAELMVSADADPKESKRQFLISIIGDRLQELPLEEISMIAQFVDRIVSYEKQMQKLRRPDDSSSEFSSNI